MWLNEGFTVFCERHTTKIIEKENEDIYKVSAYLGNASLWNDIQGFVQTGYDSYASLYPIINGKSPDDSFSTVPYEKGF